MFPSDGYNSFKTKLLDFKRKKNLFMNLTTNDVLCDEA